MRKAYFCAIFAVFIALYGLIGTLASDDKEEANFQDLTLEISSLKQNFIKLEPIAIRIEISNKKDYIVMGHFQTDFSLHFAKLLVGKDEKNLVQVNQNLAIVRSALRGKNQVIQPKEKCVTTQMLTYRLEELFPESGDYYLQLKMIDFTGEQQLLSNVLKISISEPVGRNLHAYQYIKSNTRSNFFFTALGLEKELEYFSENFSDTVYGGYVNFMLGSGRVAEKQYESAIRYLEPLLTRKDFMLSDEVLAKLIEANLKLGDKEKAKGYFEKLGGEFPNSKYTQKTSLKILSLQTP